MKKKKKEVAMFCDGRGRVYVYIFCIFYGNWIGSGILIANHTTTINKLKKKQRTTARNSANLLIICNQCI